MKKINLKATFENTKVVTDFIDIQLDRMNCSLKKKYQINIAVDELFSNIVRYAYGESVGEVEIRVEKDDDSNSVKITFIDGGIKYNPLEKKDPDTSATLKNREIGGLGIFIVKKTMDDMIYKYEDGKNILTIIKILD